MRNSIGPLELLFFHRFSIINILILISWEIELLLIQVFTCRQNQHWKAACLISLAFLLISVKNGQDEQNDCTVFNIFSICIVWVLLRLFGILDNSVDDLDIFRKCNSIYLLTITMLNILIYSGENNAELGPGIATNYWFGFLKILLQSSEDNHIRTKIENYCSKNTYTNHETYGKIILFLQNDCNFSHDSKKMEVRFVWYWSKWIFNLIVPSFSQSKFTNAFLKVKLAHEEHATMT